MLAHVDTAPAVSGHNVKPQVITRYRGGPIALKGVNNLYLSPKESPLLKNYLGSTIITTDGTTLLGADNKAGVAIIVTLAELLLAHPEICHGDIKIGFTPDEEVGQGTKYFDLKKFAADFAYTLDGELAPELNKETFSADGATITITGKDIHPGMAKNIMVNANRIAASIIAKLPRNMSPETTAGYQPYLHPYSVQSSVASATIKFLLRDFKTAGLKKLRQILEKIIRETKREYPKAKIILEVQESYRNMADYMEADDPVIKHLEQAAKVSGLKPHWQPIRGGTDGSRLTAMGLKTPNIFTGSSNLHSVTEWASLRDMMHALLVVFNLTQILVN